MNSGKAAKGSDMKRELMTCKDCGKKSPLLYYERCQECYKKFCAIENLRNAAEVAEIIFSKFPEFGCRPGDARRNEVAKILVLRGLKVFSGDFQVKIG